MARWDPWRGCKRCSDGCLHCYIHKGDAKRGIDTGNIHQTKDFYKPIGKLKNGEYKMKSGLVYLCFSSDFLLEEADAWRGECWKMIRQRTDCTFLFLTKRIERFMDCIPDDWGNGYGNVVVCCTVENQKNADRKLSVFQKLPIQHKCITAQPLIGPIQMEQYLEGIESVTVGGESDYAARPLDYNWVLDIREQCIRQNVSFVFRQCGTYFIKDGITYKLHTMLLCSQARKANINYISTKNNAASLYIPMEKMVKDEELEAAEKHKKEKEGNGMYKVLCYPGCSTCKKAEKWLKEHAVSYDYRDIKTENPTFEELKAWYQASKLPLKKFFNTSGLLYKSMELKDKLPNMTEEEMLRLLASDGMLVKRPLLIGEGTVLVGFKETEWESQLKTGE